jgi:hypothetical protein
VPTSPDTPPSTEQKESAVHITTNRLIATAGLCAAAAGAIFIAEVAELSDSLSVSFLVLLETLTPIERAVFLLREAFDYPYDEIAEIVKKSEANCRQILSRARRRIDQGKPRFKVNREQQRELAASFLQAVEDGSSTSWSRCWPPTSCSTVTAVARARASRGRSTAPPVSGAYSALPATSSARQESDSNRL